MSYHNRIETRDRASFITTRTCRGELWLANNKPLEDFALALVAKASTRYSTKNYCLGFEGTHYHLAAKFPLLRRSDFLRDVNSGLAVAVARLTPHYPGGKLWHRRYSVETIAEDQDIEREFFYTVLQPVKDGLVSKISEYPFYNCFSDAVSGHKRKFKLLNITKYHAAKRHNPKVHRADFIEEYILQYDRIPGYEHLTQQEYSTLMHQKLEEHRQEIIKARERAGKTKFVGREALLRVVPGTPAINPKVSTFNSHRPRVLASCPKRRAAALDWYFSIYRNFKEASKRYRAGDLLIPFPPGTYRPPLWLVVLPSGPVGPYSIMKQ